MPNCTDWWFLRKNRQLDSFDCQIRQQLTWLTYQIQAELGLTRVSIASDTGRFHLVFPKCYFNVRAMACDRHQSKFDASATKRSRCGQKIYFQPRNIFENNNPHTFTHITRYTTDIYTLLKNALALCSINFRLFNNSRCNLKSALGHAFNFPLCPRVSISILPDFRPFYFICSSLCRAANNQAGFNPIEIELYTGEMERRCLAKIVWCLSKTETVTSGRRGGKWFLVLCAANLCTLGFSNACPPFPTNRNSVQLRVLKLTVAV